MRRWAPGEYAAAGLVGAALVFDVVLIRRDCDPISTCVRRGFVARLAVVALAAHLLFHIRHDPLTWAAGRLLRAR